MAEQNQLLPNASSAHPRMPHAVHKPNLACCTAHMFTVFLWRSLARTVVTSPKSAILASHRLAEPATHQHNVGTPGSRAENDINMPACNMYPRLNRNDAPCWS